MEIVSGEKKEAVLKRGCGGCRFSDIDIDHDLMRAHIHKKRDRNKQIEQNRLIVYFAGNAKTQNDSSTTTIKFLSSSYTLPCEDTYVHILWTWK